MKRMIVSCAVLAAVLLVEIPTSNINAAESKPLPAGVVRVQQAVIIDPNGFGQPMPAATLMIPAGWKEQGGIVWQQNNAGCGPRDPHVSWMATSPDGVSALQLLPEEDWSGHSMMYQGMPQSQCPNVTITDMQQYVMHYAERLRPGAQFERYRERADLVAEAQSYLQPQQQIYGMESNQWVGAGEAFISYSVDGQKVSELVGTIALFNHTRMSDGMGGVTETLQISTAPGYAFRAPEGELDLDTVEMIRRSYKIHPAWQAQMNQHRAIMAGIAAKGAADRARIRSQTNAEIQRMQQEGWENYTQSMDRNSREFQEYIRGTETYNNPNGGTVQLDNTYDHAWALDDGSYILSNDSGFDPGKDLGLSGSRLEKSQ
ncbi:MAG: hypothetical protein ACR2QT_04770 [Woeseiaceae bacterium]